MGIQPRCETAGLIGIVVIVMAVCTVHHVTTGSMTIGCDNKMSLRVFAPDFIPDPAEESFDLVSCLHALIKKASIAFHPEHVEGHQKGKRQLTRLELLNDEMDHSAKAFWNHLLETGHPMTPPMMHIADEGFSIWHEGNKLSSAHSNVIYPILEDHHTINYWTKDHHNHPRRIPPQAITNVDWNACRDFMGSLKLCDRRRIPKHASENCGVNATLQEWKKQSHNRCPRCDQPETAQHVLVCRAEGADPI